MNLSERIIIYVSTDHLFGKLVNTNNAVIHNKPDKKTSELYGQFTTCNLLFHTKECSAVM